MNKKNIFIGEAPLSELPKQHFKYTIKDGAITANKIAYNSISREKLSPSLKDSIDKKADTERVSYFMYELDKKIGKRTVVNGNVTNLPDEEDLTYTKENEHNVIKLADRSYSPYNFSGKGYKILRKNIQKVSLAVTNITVNSVPSADGYISFIINGIETHVDLVVSTDNTTALVAQKIATKLSETMTEYEVLANASTVTLTRKFGDIASSSSFSANSTGVSCVITDTTKSELSNLITAIMLNQPNTIYEIRYDFDLNGETIEMPEGCTLKFDGGSLKNGTLKGNNTNIDAKQDWIFKISLDGSLNTKYLYPEWFGAIGDGISDDTHSIQKCIIFASKLCVPVCFINKYKLTQIKMYDNDYYFNNSTIYQSLSIPCIVNNNIDKFGAGTTYSAPEDIFTAINNNDVNKINIYGNLYIKKTNDYKQLSREEQKKYAGFRWDDGNIIADSPVNFVGLYNSNIQGVHIEYTTRAMNLNLGFSALCKISECTLSMGVDNCLQLFHTYQCEATNCRFINGGGGILVMQGCNLCSFTNNYLLYDKEIKGVNQHIISIKNSEDCTISNNIIYCVGENFVSAIGICITTQETGFYSRNITVEANKLKNCGIGIFVENTSNASVYGNNLDKCALQNNKADIVLNNSYNVSVLSNNINHDIVGDKNLYHGILIMSGDYLNIAYNNFLALGNKMLIIFGKTNTETKQYKIHHNYARNKSMEGYGIFFEHSELFKYNLINNNNFYNIYNQIKAGSFKRENLNDYGGDESYNPTPSSIDIGYLFFDTARNKPIFFNGREYVSADGISSTISSKGESTKRPTGVSAGFEYYDTTLKKKILWNGDSWVNIDGTGLS